MEQKQLIELLDKYLAGKCTPEELIVVEQWYVSQQKTDNNFYSGDQEAIQKSASRSLLALQQKLGIADDQFADAATNGKSNMFIRWLAAACFLISGSIGFLMYYNNVSKTQTYTIVQTGTGQTKKIKLPDGTMVWLNAGTILKYPSTFNKTNRQIYLNGEAYFDVVHDKNRPFNVHSGNVQTHVLGTAFSVSAYPNALISNVTVVRGKVQVSDKKHLLAYVLPNQELEYAVKEQKSKVININSEKMVAWTNGKLAFVDMPMQDIAIHLQKWYGVNFVFKNQQLKKVRFTASFSNTVSLNDLLAVMYDVSHVNYSVDNKTQTVTYL